MIVYIVLKVGVYIQDIAGCFTDPEKAKEEASLLASTCIDSRHKYAVAELPLNQPLASGICEWFGHDFKQLKEIAHYRKSQFEE